MDEANWWSILTAAIYCPNWISRTQIRSRRTPMDDVEIYLGGSSAYL